jgi:hypothetical protein
MEALLGFHVGFWDYITFVISFHIVFPAFTIGLAAWLATIEARG